MTNQVLSELGGLDAVNGGVVSGPVNFTAPVTLSGGAVSLAPGITLPSYIGPVATRTYMQSATASGNKQAMAATPHYSRSTITTLQVGIPNFYVTPNVGEVGNGAVATATASVEYPIGTFTTFTFGGVRTATVPSNSWTLSDSLSISIPKNVMFRIRIFWQNANGIIYGNNNGGPNPSLGEALNFAASGLTDQTLGGTITSNQSQYTFGPCLLIGKTTGDTFGIIGDSRSAGNLDIVNNGDVGMIARSLGPYFGYVHTGVTSDTASGFLAAGTNRVQLLSYASKHIVEMGVNDIYTNSSTAAQVLTMLTSIQALTGKPSYITTMPPYTSSTDSWATTTNQTVHGTGNPARVTFNDTARTVPAPFVGCLEIADLTESGRDSGLWAVTGITGLAQTGDGLHPSPYGYAAIAASKMFPTSLFCKSN